MTGPRSAARLFTRRGAAMTAGADWSRQWDVFHAAVELPAAERAAFVGPGHCARQCRTAGPGVAAHDRDRGQRVLRAAPVRRRAAPPEAEPHFAFAADGARRLFKESDVLRGHYLLNHGRCLGRLGRGDEGEARLLEAYAIISGVLGPTSATTREALNELVVLYKAMGRTEQAASRRAEFLALPKPEPRR